MELLLLGNGFDLYHRLPTKYQNFLNTVHFLTECYDPSMITVGTVFGDPRLQEADPWIKVCYETHKPLFDLARISEEHIADLTARAKKNVWFRYLYNSFNRDIGWIDFEKEVSAVVEAFDAFFKAYPSHESLEQVLSYMRADQRFINDEFNFFYDTPLFGINDEYLIEYPLGSGYFLLHTEKIVDGLFQSLLELGELLKDYLRIFVQSMGTVAFFQDYYNGTIFKNSFDHIVTFNYTPTYQNFYTRTARNARICHLHGTTESKIILGINPTSADAPGTVDTTFLRFKKYYQRVLNGTDSKYLAIINGYAQQTGHKLTVFGHSLDKTDEDIIRECFKVCDRITIYYYEPDFYSTVRNLIGIFGKGEFDNLRREKNLTFLPQPPIKWERYIEAWKGNIKQ